MKCPICGDKRVAFSPVAGFSSVIFECDNCSALFDADKNIVLFGKGRSK